LTPQLCTFEVSGVGIHTGELSTVTVSKGRPSSGIIFVSEGVEIPAVPDAIDESASFCTALKGRNRSILTIEHLMAALAAVGSTDVRIEIAGPEIPILDGSAAPWLEMLKKNGARERFRFFHIENQIVIESRGAVAQINPISPEETPSIEVVVDLSAIDKAPSRRLFFPTLEPFEKIAGARTFAFENSVAEMLEAGYAKGGSLRNALIIGTRGVLNPEGARFPDEPARHKILDAIGDLALLGQLIHGRVTLTRPGHHLLHKVVKAVWNNVQQQKTQHEKEPDVLGWRPVF
jgi:UDP-3-O-[3-hydroxymyristoyl] N-acetylglucosamine deacetylase